MAPRTLSDVFAPVIGDLADCSIGMVRAHPYRTGWRRVLNSVTLGVTDMARSLTGTWWLVVCPNRATLVFMALGTPGVSQTVAVPDWDAAEMSHMPPLVIGRREFVKTSPFLRLPPPKTVVD